MSMFVVKSIVIQIIGQNRDLSVLGVKPILDLCDILQFVVEFSLSMYHISLKTTKIRVTIKTINSINMQLDDLKS
jgi:hypothetical protein